MSLARCSVPSASRKSVSTVGGWLGLAFAALASSIFFLAAGVFFWSLMTAVSGLTRNFGQLFLVRLGVGSVRQTFDWNFLTFGVPPGQLIRPFHAQAMGSAVSRQAGRAESRRSAL